MSIQFLFPYFSYSEYLITFIFYDPPDEVIDALLESKNFRIPINM